jgi:type I pantothenate kinase
MSRKGFPESYDRPALLQFLHDMKSGKSEAKVPVYSHAVYDITDSILSIAAPDILIIEGLNILQTPDLSMTQRIYASDYIDFNIFVDADAMVIKTWFLERFRAFREQALGKSHLFFHQFTTMSDEDALALADHIWETVNAPNLQKNILPYKYRAELILHKGMDHGIEDVYLKRV